METKNGASKAEAVDNNKEAGSEKKKYQKPSIKTEKLTAIAAMCNGSKKKNTLGVGKCVNGAKS